MNLVFSILLLLNKYLMFFRDVAFILRFKKELVQLELKFLR